MPSSSTTPPGVRQASERRRTTAGICAHLPPGNPLSRSASSIRSTVHSATSKAWSTVSKPTWNFTNASIKTCHLIVLCLFGRTAVTSPTEKPFDLAFYEPLAILRVVRQSEDVTACSVPHCLATKPHALGFCRNHYYKHYRSQPTYLSYQQTEHAIEVRRARERRRYYREKTNPKRAIKKRAYAAVHKMINSGRLKPLPCEVCSLKAQAHHDSYLPED